MSLLRLHATDSELRQEGTGLARALDSVQDGKRFQNWVSSYQHSLNRSAQDQRPVLLQLGQQIDQWLGGSDQWIARALGEERKTALGVGMGGP